MRQFTAVTIYFTLGLAKVYNISDHCCGDTRIINEWLSEIFWISQGCVCIIDSPGLEALRILFYSYWSFFRLEVCVYYYFYLGYLSSLCRTRNGI